MTHRSFAGWPALLAIYVPIIGALYLTPARNERAVRVKTVTISTQARALAAE